MTLTKEWVNPEGGQRSTGLVYGLKPAYAVAVPLPKEWKSSPDILEGSVAHLGYVARLLAGETMNEIAPGAGITTLTAKPDQLYHPLPGRINGDVNITGISDAIRGVTRRIGQPHLDTLKDAAGLAASANIIAQLKERFNPGPSNNPPSIFASHSFTHPLKVFFKTEAEDSPQPSHITYGGITLQHDRNASGICSKLILQATTASPTEPSEVLSITLNTNPGTRRTSKDARSTILLNHHLVRIGTETNYPRLYQPQLLRILGGMVYRMVESTADKAQAVPSPDGQH